MFLKSFVSEDHRSVRPVIVNEHHSSVRTELIISDSIFFYIIKYTPQNNLRTTSFISPLIITKMQPSSFSIISWTKLEVSALLQSAQHVCNMFSYKSVNDTNNARPKDSKKNGNSSPPPPRSPPHPEKKQKTIFYPKMKFFSQYRKKIFV